MSDETLMLAKQKGAMLVTTDFTQELMDLYHFFDTDRAEIIDRLKRAHKIGIPLVYGSDVVALMPGHTRGSASLSLIDSWVDAGIPPNTILQALTTNAAKLLGIENERGIIKQGMMADIIATPENPLENIQTLKKVKFVMKEGQVYRSYSKQDF
jgi:imidazolonepropionase-like amidohydrolase